MENPCSSILVVCAHSSDFVWRASGAIAKYVRQNYRVVVLSLSYGERGESASLWNEPSITLEEVKRVREKEARSAASALGAELRLLDLGDAPLRIDDGSLLQIADVMREIRPGLVLTHGETDPFNPDHPRAARATIQARNIAQAAGYRSAEGKLGACQILFFEPHQTESSNWKPDILLDISDDWDRKMAAIKCLEHQKHLWDYYVRVAMQRGAHASRNSGRKILYAEGFMRQAPQVVHGLI